MTGCTRVRSRRAWNRRCRPSSRAGTGRRPASRTPRRECWSGISRPPGSSARNRCVKPAVRMNVDDLNFADRSVAFPSPRNSCIPEDSAECIHSMKTVSGLCYRCRNRWISEAGCGSESGCRAWFPAIQERFRYSDRRPFTLSMGWCQSQQKCR